MSKQIRKSEAVKEKQGEEEFPYRPQKKQRLTREEFLHRHPELNLEAAGTKIQISIKLDQEVLEFFKRRAAAPNAAPYQTQINHELRAVMERESQGAQTAFADLVEDPAFILAVAQKIAVLKPDQGIGKRKKAA